MRVSGLASPRSGSNRSAGRCLRHGLAPAVPRVERQPSNVAGVAGRRRCRRRPAEPAVPPDGLRAVVHPAQGAEVVRRERRTPCTARRDVVHDAGACSATEVLAAMPRAVKRGGSGGFPGGGGVKRIVRHNPTVSESEPSRHFQISFLYSPERPRRLSSQNHDCIVRCGLVKRSK